MHTRPNIVYLHSHDTGRYVRPYGYDLPTPRIQRLAEEGVIFRHAFSAAPTCSPSRAALLTGCYPHEAGMLGLAHRGFAMPNHSRHLVNTLRAAGYASALAGVQHVATDPSEIGYDHVATAATPGMDRSAATVAPLAVDFLRRARTPFFLDVGFSETHRPFPEPGPEDDPRYCQPPPALPDRPETRADMAGYRASVRQLDEGVGMVLDALQETGLADNTLVICTTDHGIAFPHMKGNLTQHGTGVLLIMRGPGSFAGGTVCDSLVSQVDLYPTICDVADVPRPEWLRGSSLVPLLRGETDRIREHAFAESNYHVGYDPQRAVRTERWSYIRRFDPQPIPPILGDGGPSRSLMQRDWRAEEPREQELLFDLLYDPQESRNLIADPIAAPPAATLRAVLDDWMRETADPLLRGAVPMPAGARVETY